MVFCCVKKDNLYMNKIDIDLLSYFVVVYIFDYYVILYIMYLRIYY